jgi:hypothetical protein
MRRGFRVLHTSCCVATRTSALHHRAPRIAFAHVPDCSSMRIKKSRWNKDYMHDSSALTKTHEQRIDDRFPVRQDGNDAPVHHRFTLLKFFFGFGSVEVFPALDSDRNRANRTPSDSRARSCDMIFFATMGARGVDSNHSRRTLSCARSGSGRSMTVFCRSQTPSLRLSRSFTACGLAFPPDAFIT